MRQLIFHLCILCLASTANAAKTPKQWTTYEDDIFTFAYPTGWQVTGAPAQAPDWQRLWRVARVGERSVVPQGAMIIAQYLDGKEKRPLDQIFKDLKRGPDRYSVYGKPTKINSGAGKCLTFLTWLPDARGCVDRATGKNKACYETQYNLNCYGPNGDFFLFFTALGSSSKAGVIEDEVMQDTVNIMKHITRSLKFRGQKSGDE